MVSSFQLVEFLFGFYRTFKILSFIFIVRKHELAFFHELIAKIFNGIAFSNVHDSILLFVNLYSTFLALTVQF